MTFYAPQADCDRLAKYLYDLLNADVDDTAPLWELLYQLGYTDDNSEWIYDDE